MNQAELKRITGARIRNLRVEKARNENKRITQDIAAEAVGVRLVTYGKWERGQALPALDHAISLSNFYEVPIDFIAGLSDQRFSGLTYASSKDARIPWKCSLSVPDEAAIKAIHLFEHMASGRYVDWKAFLADHKSENKPEVIHLIQLAISKSWVQILPLPQNENLEIKLKAKFRLKRVAVPIIPEPYAWIDNSPTRYRSSDNFPVIRSYLVGKAAAVLFTQIVNAGDAVAFSGGSIILRMAQQLSYDRQLQNLRLYPLDVLPFDTDAEYNAHSIVGLVKLNLMGEAFSFGHHIDTDVNSAPSVEKALAIQHFREAQQSQATFLGVGDPLLINSTAYNKIGLLWGQQNLKDLGAKAEILFNLVKADGSPCNPPGRETGGFIKGSSVPLSSLRNMATSGLVVGVAMGNKAKAIRAALNGGYLSGLVVDDRLAKELLDDDASSSGQHDLASSKPSEG